MPYLISPVVAGTCGGPRSGSAAARLAVAGLLWLYAVLALAPMLVMLLDAVRENTEVLANPAGLPTKQIIAGLTAGMTR